jgi:hypothetical protein
MVSAGQAFTSDGVTIARAESADMSTLLAAADAMKDPVAALQRSSWYRQRFAPLLHLRDYLARQGVLADETTLLAISADLWCLQYPKNPSASLPAYIHRKAGLERAAKFYGYEVQWVPSTSRDQTKELVRQAISAGELVLGFSHSDQGVQDLTTDGTERSRIDKPGGYRFLGEEQVVPLALARISRSPTGAPSATALAREALTDIHRLLTETTDAQNNVGGEAVRAWAEKIAASGNGIPLADPMFQALTAASMLGPTCSESYARLGLTANILRWRDACEGLQALCQQALNHQLLRQALCEKERANQWKELTEGLVKTVGSLEQEVPKR